MSGWPHQPSETAAGIPGCQSRASSFSLSERYSVSAYCNGICRMLRKTDVIKQLHRILRCLLISVIRIKSVSGKIYACFSATWCSMWLLPFVLLSCISESFSYSISSKCCNLYGINCFFIIFIICGKLNGCKANIKKYFATQRVIMVAVHTSAAGLHRLAENHWQALPICLKFVTMIKVLPLTNRFTGVYSWSLLGFINTT